MLAIETAARMGLDVVLLTGSQVKLEENVIKGTTINVPSKTTALIQESHMMILHIIAQLIDNMITMGKESK
jgi:phosphoheptose isomerase